MRTTAFRRSRLSDINQAPPAGCQKERSTRPPAGMVPAEPNAASPPGAAQAAGAARAARPGGPPGAAWATRGSAVLAGAPTRCRTHPTAGWHGAGGTKCCARSGPPQLPADHDPPLVGSQT